MNTTEERKYASVVEKRKIRLMCRKCGERNSALEQKLNNWTWYNDWIMNIGVLFNDQSALYEYDILNLESAFMHECRVYHYILCLVW